METKPPGILKRIWAVLNRPSAKYSLLAISGVSFIAGILFWGGFHTGLEMTNTLEFCTTCHEMRDTVYQEYKETIHYSNRTGVRAICSDCHVPKEWWTQMLRQMQPTFEVWGQTTGVIATQEKFQTHRI